MFLRNQTESISTGIKHISFSCDKLLVSQWLTICERIWRSWPATMWNASVATLDESSKKEGWSKHWALCRSVTWSCCLKTFWQLTQTLHNLLFLYGKKGITSGFNKKLRQWQCMSYLSEDSSLEDEHPGFQEINKNTQGVDVGDSGSGEDLALSLGANKKIGSPARKSSTQRPNRSTRRIGVSTSSAACVSSIRVASHAGKPRAGGLVVVGGVPMWCHVAWCWTVYTSFISNIKAVISKSMASTSIPTAFPVWVEELQVLPFHPMPQLRAEHVGDGCTVSAVSVSVQKAKQKARSCSVFSSVAEARFHSTACCQFSEHACEVATWK